MILRFPSDAAVLVAGIPGAGKSTLLARAADPAGARVLDTDPLRGRWSRVLGPLPYAVWRPALHAAHWVAVWRALGRPGGPVLVGEPGTRRLLRRTFVRRARRAGRTVHLLGIEASAADARAGQVARGRTIRPGSLERHAARWRRTRRDARVEFDTIRLLTRADAARVSRISFGSPAVARAHAPASLGSAA